VHGLDYCDTDDADFFPEVWSRLQEKVHAYFPFIEDGEVPFVAHNARFDEGCLRAAFATFELALPNYEFRDTLAASRNYFGSALLNHQLHTVAAACGYDLQNHHHALADAEACAWIARAIV
jgi:DNA polymerase-3 subunit epsilon